MRVAVSDVCSPVDNAVRQKKRRPHKLPSPLSAHKKEAGRSPPPRIDAKNNQVQLLNLKELTFVLQLKEPVVFRYSVV